ncbi:MAG: hypothetical protein JNK04_15775, partial [Myxococcales bacterium]|nr:hypothetical protein [Myxococcales bacterium]
MKRALLAVALAATLGAKAADEQPSLNMHFSIAVASSVTADIVVPTRLDQPVRLRDRRSSVAIDVTLLDGAAVPATPADDDGRELVFRNALPGADVSIRTTERGFEDFTRYKQRPDREQARYAIDLENAAGLRLVDDVLEVLDAAGAPRLRMKRPWVRGGDGVVHRLGVKVTGCAIDTSPVAPWGRTPTPPGATRCLLTLDWSREGVQYPALLDPGWTTTDEMSEGRYDATLCPTVGGRAIVAGGLVDADLSLTSAEL